MLKTLRLDVNGPEVRAWKIFLVGQDQPLEVNDLFDDTTRLATANFQRNNRLSADGVVGPKTYSVALALGFPAVIEPGVDETSSNWPPRPNYAPPYAVDRERLFGKFSYVASPTAVNPEAVKITDNWADSNLVWVHIPQLLRVTSAPRDCRIQFHAKAAGQLQALWAAWEKDQLLPLVISFAGSWVPRFIRGSRSTLSNHAWGTAFDINAPQNALGVIPALVGNRGSVRKLVPLAEQHGFYWGGWYGHRPDGMHFEVARIL